MSYLSERAASSPPAFKIKKDAVASFLSSPTACFMHARLVGYTICFTGKMK